MPGIPVVVSTNGLGTPVKSVASGGPVMTVATNGRGIPIVLSDRGAPFVVEGAVVPDPAMSRVAVTQGYSSDANATTISGLTANAARTFTASNLTVTDSIAYIGYKTAGAITGKGAFLSFGSGSAIPNSIVSSMVFEYCTDISGFDARVTAVGAAAAIAESAATSGLTWASIPFTAKRPTAEASTNDILTRNQLVEISALSRCVIRAKWVKDTSGTARAISFALFQRPQSGTPDDVVLFCGPSLIAQQTGRNYSSALVGKLTTRDPVVIQFGKAGANANEVVTQTIQAGLAAFPYASTMIIDPGGNDITDKRPYNGGPSDGSTEITTAFSAIPASFAAYPNCKYFVVGITYRNYLLNTPIPGQPAVNGLTNPEAGSKPYIDNIQAPWLSANLADSWDAMLGIPRVDRYSYVMRSRATTLQADGIHMSFGSAGTAGRDDYTGYIGDRAELAYAYDRRINGSWLLKGFVERFIAGREAAGNIATADKDSVAACIAQWPPVQNGAQTTARNALIARLNALAVV